MLGRNGVGKTSLLRAIVGQQPISVGRDPLERRGYFAPGTACAGARRDCDRTAGPRDLSAADGAGKPRDGICRGRAGQPLHSGSGLRAVSGPEGHAGATRRRSFRRTAAATCDRARDGDAAEAAACSTSRRKAFSRRSSRTSRRAIDYLRSTGEMAIVLVEQYFEFARDLADTLWFLTGGRWCLRERRSEMDEAMYADILPSDFRAVRRPAPDLAAFVSSVAFAVDLDRSGARNGDCPSARVGWLQGARAAAAERTEIAIINTGGGIAGGDRSRCGLLG